MTLASSENWSEVDVQSRDGFQASVRTMLSRPDPFLVGKVGANELNLLYWLERLPVVERGMIFRRLHIWNLRTCETVAGLKPRTRNSYREFSLLLRQASIDADFLGVWRHSSELNLYRHLGLNSCFYDLFDICPWFARPDCAWSPALSGKRVFVVSPFLASINQQLERRELVWLSRPGLLPEVKLCGYKYPYLLSAGSVLDWRDVYKDVLVSMKNTDFDVALFGCGALGLPLAMEAKRLGRQALHMGGFLQVLFGIHGGRFRRDPAYADLINEHWISPSAEETPPESAAVEEGCYW